MKGNNLEGGEGKKNGGAVRDVLTSNELVERAKRSFVVCDLVSEDKRP